MKQTVIDAIKADLGQIDCVVYSLASPRRTHPKTGETFKSVLKPIGQSYTNKNLNTTTKEVNEVTIEPATQDEIDQTVAVMGGEDWEMWIDALRQAGVLADGVKTVSYSYIGPEVTWPIYANGTIGVAKADLETTQKRLDEKLAPLGGKAWVVVAKAVVTQASSAIPVVPLYISLLYKVMKAKGNHEDTIQQMDRLFRERLYGKAEPQPDDRGRIRIDDWEMTDEVQAAVDEAWKAVETGNLDQYADYEGYQYSFLRLFGFGLDDVDYTAEADPATGVPSLAE